MSSHTVGSELAARELPVPLDWEAARAQQCVHDYLLTLAEGSSRNSMASTLRRIAELSGYDDARMPWHLLRASHVSAIRSELARVYAPSTSNKMLAALRGVLGAAWRAEMISTDEHRRAIDAAKAVKGSRLAAGRALSVGELSALFEACGDGTPAGARDAAALALLYGCALRRSEAISVKLEDLMVESAMATITVVGKGNKQRHVYAFGGAFDALTAWIAVRGGTGGPLLCPVQKEGRVQVGLPMSANAVMNRLTRRSKQAGIPKCSPHDLRRTFLSAALNTGGDITAVQRLAGHASPATTALYDHRGDEAAKRTAGMVHVPYVSPNG